MTISKENDENIKLHSPEELLAVADSLLTSKKNELMRAVVLEAITALEAYVHEVVFKKLEQKLSPDLVELLKVKTKMDFDSRLSVLVSTATDVQIDKGGELWQDYKKSKKIRNKVTHSGKVVTFDEAKFVLNTVYKWLTYLGSTAEVDIALIGLRNYLKDNTNLFWKNNGLSEANIQRSIVEYFSKIKPTKLTLENIKTHPDGFKIRADIALEFGEHNVVIEIKRLQKDFSYTLKAAVLQLERALGAYSNKHRGVVVIYTMGDIPEYYKKIRTIENSRISVVAV